MTQAEKEIIIQYLQCSHAEWLESFNEALSYGICPDKWRLANIYITNYIDVVYRYKPFSDEVTNAYSVDVSVISEDTEYIWTTFDVVVGATVLYSHASLDPLTLDEILELAIESINTNNPSGYTAVLDGESIILYTTDPGESFTIPSIKVVAYTVLGDAVELGVTTTSLENNLDFLLNLINCLTVDELCAVITAIKTTIKSDICGC